MLLFQSPYLKGASTRRGSCVSGLTLALALVLCASSLSAQPSVAYNHGDPTDAEQLTLELINRARANPVAEGQRLITSTDPGVLNAIAVFNVNTQAVIDAFNSYEATPPLAFHPQLIAAARRHSRDMIDFDEQTHQISPDGPNLRERTVAEGYTSQSFLRENVYAYVDNPWMGHAAFQIDWGFGPSGIQDPPGHRIAIMDIGNADNPFTEIGIGYLADDNPAGTEVTGPFVVTHNFGRPVPGVAYLTGVVYEDTDGDGFYSEGEGLAGITIIPDRGDFFAVTSSSGGYAIPVTGLTGQIEVTASGPGFGPNQTVSVSLNGQNIKVDFQPATDPVTTHFGSGSSRSGHYISTAWFAGFHDLQSALGLAPGFLFHDQHGHIFYVGNENGLWFFSPSLGWVWTQRAFYPFLYSSNLNAWLYYYERNTQPRLFYNTATGSFLLSDARE